MDERICLLLGNTQKYLELQGRRVRRGPPNGTGNKMHGWKEGWAGGWTDGDGWDRDADTWKNGDL